VVRPQSPGLRHLSSLVQHSTSLPDLRLLSSHDLAKSSFVLLALTGAKMGSKVSGKSLSGTPHSGGAGIWPEDLACTDRSSRGNCHRVRSSAADAFHPNFVEMSEASRDHGERNGSLLGAVIVQT
jgi:hypothetical protein